MSKYALGILAAVMFAASALSAVPPEEQAAPPPADASEPMKIGYVDLTAVLKEYKRQTDLDADIRALKDSLTAKENAAIAQLERIRAEIEQLAMGTPAREKLEKQLAEAAASLDEHRRKGYGLLDARFVESISKLYADITREIEELGREENFDLILKDQTTQSQPDSYNEVVLQISQRVVLYSKPQYDLTARVVSRLNDRYAARKKAEATEEQTDTVAAPAPEEEEN